MSLALVHRRASKQTNAEYSRQPFFITPSDPFYSEETPRYKFLGVVGSTVTTVDLSAKLLTDLLESGQKTKEWSVISIKEFVDWGRIVKKLSALEAVIGLLSDLTTQEITEFDEAVKRRPLFEK